MQNISLPENFLMITYNNGPESSLPLSLCQGDCNKDSDCADGLVCLSRTKDEPVPGCVGYPLDFFDYCVDPDAEVLDTDGPEALPPPGLLSLIFSDGTDESVLPLQVSPTVLSLGVF